MTDMSDIVERLHLLQSGAAWVCGETAATLEDAADEIERLRAERDRLRAAQEPTTMWRHIKRGSVYREICRAEVQAATGPICEGDMVVIYGDALGHVWARKVSEFEDGRFERVAALKETGHD
jgi:hypothetical protein